MTSQAPEPLPAGPRRTARRLARRVVTTIAGEAVESVTSAEDVRDVEIQEHINPARGRQGAEADTLVGLALSGGGIRSATFGLGVIQALRALDVFKHLDYVSSVSGGGYLNGWLQAVTARRSVDRALPTDATAPQDRQEPRQIRFLRAYSNYLTPKLGLFSGDTWAAVGISLRNLVLNLGVLSLSLVPPLYLPWLLTLGFWRLVPDQGHATLSLVFAGVFLAMTMSVSTLNMSQPLKDGSWNRPVGTQAPTWLVLAFVVLPALAGIGFISPLAWTLAVQGRFAPDAIVWVSVAGGAWYALVWFVGAVGGFAMGRAWWTRSERVAADWPKLLRAFGVLVATAFVAGAVGAPLGAIGTRWLAQGIDGDHTWLVWLLVFPTWVLALLTAVTVHIGLAGRWLSEETREWWGRVTGVQLLVTLLVVTVSALSLAGPHLWEWRTFPSLSPQHRESINAGLAVLWAAVTGTGILAGRSRRTSTGGGSLLERAGSIAPIVFIVGYLILVATFLHHQVPHLLPPFGRNVALADLRGFTFDDVEESLRQLVNAARQRDQQASLPLMPWYEPSLLLMAFVVSGLAVGLSRRVDLNEFSLHALYRNRLVRCYLGASNPKRAAHPFTGFDPNDDVPLSATARADRATPIRPYPLFNVAMNLVGGKNLAWQQRKAASFIFSPEYCGFEYRVDEDNEQERLGTANGNGRHDRRSAYAKTGEYGGDPESLTVGLAVATSGAAASPNMGYHTSPTLSFLMTVFNVRLGWWLRNPRWTRNWSDGNARLSLKELLSELLGMTTDDRYWVYLSDGGHFENLGLYELVRRRCRFIIACDAGQDGAVTFEDLGNAIEKCRADFGINIEIDLSRLRPQGDPRFSASHCAIGTIRYDELDPDNPPGTLFYIKCSLTGDEPADVLRYASAHPAFPHESTADQFFDESQFESYRALGYHTACATLTAAADRDEMAGMPVVQLFTHLRQQWTVSAPVPADAIRKYSAVLSDIWTTVRTTQELRFLDAQMFPAWASLLVSGDLRGAAAQPAAARPKAVDYWLPDTIESRRAGFYVCNQMLQLMEDVYIEFGLDEHHDHIDNRGWMNLFQHWAWSGMLTATWAIIGSTFDPRFQRFCRRRLGLELGRPYIFMDQEYWLPTPAEWNRAGFERPQYVEEWEHGGARLNFFEVQLVDRFLRASTVAQSLQLMPIRVYVPSPRRDEHNLDFNVGYVIAHVDWPGRVFRLHHMRIQNHLRKMGLAGHTLDMVTAPTSENGWGLQLEIVEPEAVVVERVNVALDEALPSRSGARRLQRIVDSLR